MTREEMFEKVKKTLMENCDWEEDEVTEEAGLKEDLDATSLELVDLAMELEKGSDIKIELEEFSDVETVKDVVDLIEAKSREIKKEETV